LGSLTMRKTYGLKGYSDSCPMYLATIGGWRLCLQSTSLTLRSPRSGLRWTITR